MKSAAFLIYYTRKGEFLAVFLSAYFDESDDNDRAYGVGGFIGTQLDCVHMDWAWQEHILDRYGLKYFKASELEWGVGEFRKFRDDPNNTDARFSEREKGLFREIKTKTVDLFLTSELVGFGGVVVLPDYHRLVEEFKPAGRAIPSPYWFGTQLMFMEAGFIMNYLNEAEMPTKKGYVRPIFDTQEEYSGRARQVYEDYCKKNPITSKWLLPPAYENDQDYIVLQVADNLIYEMRKLVIKDAFNEVKPERIAMQRLKESVSKVYKLNYDIMKAIMERPANVMDIQPEIVNPISLGAKVMNRP